MFRVDPHAHSPFCHFLWVSKFCIVRPATIYISIYIYIHMYMHICLYNDGLQFSASLYRAFFMCISTALVLGWSCCHSVIPHGIRACGNAAESLELSVYFCNGHVLFAISCGYLNFALLDQQPYIYTCIYIYIHTYICIYIYVFIMMVYNFLLYRAFFMCISTALVLGWSC